MDENNFYDVQEYLKAELESIQNGTARFCTLEELDLALTEVIENYKNHSLEDNQKHFLNKATNRSVTRSK